MTVTVKRVKEHRYEEYVSDYDCMMLCLTLISSMKCSRTEKMYLCEVASNISGNNAELAGLLVSEGKALIESPVATAQKVFRENEIPFENLHERVNKAVWEAQIKYVFPKLESFRAEIIRKHGAKLQRYLPIRSSNGDSVVKADDLELGQIYFICKENSANKITDRSEYEMLKRMREIRNTLAHWSGVTYKQLNEANVL